MTITNAIKKLEKAGFTIENFENRIFYARNPKASRLIEFHRNGRSEDVAIIHLQREGEKACHHTDYFPGFFVDTITKAIKRAI